MLQKYEEYGLAAWILAQASPKEQLDAFHARTKTAIALDQVMFVFDRSGNPLAYWTWASLTIETHRRAMVDPLVHLHPSEWNEGQILWVMDLVVARSHFRDVAAYIRRDGLRASAQVWIDRILVAGHSRLKRRWTTVPGDDYQSWSTRGKVYRLPRQCFATSYSTWLSQPDRPSTAF
jgi:hemolysin-activating ACP:hemolysin acyltransferase